VPLTEFQADLARLLAAGRSPDSYLAGGAALYVEPNTSRYSNDLDYFHDSEERVASAFADDRRALAAAGYEIDLEISQPGFVRATVRKGDGGTKVEWAHDSAWRFLPAVAHEITGYSLHPIDLAINKVLALVGRDEPRDFLDTLHVHRTVLPLGALIWAAAGKDSGYTPFSLLDLLRRRGRYRAEDFERLRLASPVDLPALKTEWREALEQADSFVHARPPNEVGCLYYSPTARRFVAPDPADPREAQPHYGRPGGVLPVVAA
jgi:hypothetical protein